MLTKLFRLVIGIVLGYGLIHFTLKSTGADLWSEIYQANIPLLLLALVFYGAILTITSYRWNLLLRVQGVDLGGWEVIRLVLIGVCFNFMIPGAVGGDLPKMALVTQRTKDRKAEAVLTVFLDRVLGLLGLLIVASAAVIFYLPFLLDLEKEYRPIQIAAFTVGLGSVGGLFAIILLGFRQTIMNHPWIARLVEWCSRKLPASVVSTLKRLISALELYRHNRKIILVAIILSVFVHLCLATNLFFVSMSVAGKVIRLSDCLLATQVANAVAAIPITPAGIGTRDAIVAMFFSAMHVPSGKSGVIPVIMSLILLFWGLVGAVILVFSKFPKYVDQGTTVLAQKGESDVPL